MNKHYCRDFLKKTLICMTIVAMLVVSDVILPVSESTSSITGGPILTEAAEVTYYKACSKSCNSFVDGLKSIGVDSSYANRKQIASMNGYSNYTGTAAQNNNLLLLLKQGRLVKSVTNTTVSGGSRIVNNGWYMIVSGNDAQKVLDIKGWGTNDGSNLQIYDKENGANQRFYLEYLNNGFYSIRSLHSGKWLHVSDGNNKYANVHQWSGWNHNNAQWVLSSAGNGYYYFRNRANGSYLDNNGGSNKSGNNVATYPYNGSNAQKWKIVSTSDAHEERKSLADGWYEVQSGNGNSFVWDIRGAGKNDGTNLEIHPKNSGNNQKFYVKYLNNGYYSIMAGHSNKYLHKQDAGMTDNVLQWSGYSTGAVQTQWAIDSVGNGYYYVRSKAGNYIDNSGGYAKAGNNVITYLWNGSNAQKWKFVKTDAPGTNSSQKPVTQNNDVTSRLNSLMNKYVGTYWTKDGKPSDSSGTTSKYYYGIQCKGFAGFIFNELFKTGNIGAYDSRKYYIPNPNGAREVGKVWNFASTDTTSVKNLLSKGKPGDFIQVRRRGKSWGHSMILVSVNSSSVTVFDCNSDGKCGVKKYTITWSDFAKKNVGMSLYHSTKY